MKRSIYAFSLLAAIIIGCQTELVTDSFIGDKSAVFDASTEVFVPQTKTLMTADKHVVWSAGDQVAIFQGSTLPDRYEATWSSAGQGNAIFEIVADNSTVNGNFSAGTELPCNVAVYPYADGLSLAGEVLQEGAVYIITGFSLPDTQTYKTGSFGDGSFPMVAVTKGLADHNLNFKNVLGTMKLQLKGTQTVKSIKVEGKNNEKLSGAATVIAYTDGTKPAITMAQSASTSVTLNCGSGVPLSESTATEFIIALPPVLFSQGFTVIVTDSEDEIYTVETDKANAVLRSSLLVMPAFKLGEIPGDDSDEGWVEGDEKEILLIPGGGRTTKAGVSGVVDISNYPATENFDIYAYWANEQEGSWFTDATHFLTNNTSGVEFVNKGTGWGGIEPYYWPKNGSLRFAAYSPASLDIVHDLQTDTYILNDYIQSHETDKTIDLLLAPTTSSKTAANDVAVEFEHALAWITFKVRAQNAEFANVFTINRITLKDVYTQADLQASMADGIQADEWMNLESRKDYVVFDGNTILGENSVVLETVPNGTIVIPQEETSVSIDYTLLQSGTTRNITIDLRSCLFWKPGRCYNYEFVLGLDALSVGGSITCI